MSKAEDHKIPENVTVFVKCPVSGIYCWKFTMIQGEGWIRWKNKKEVGCLWACSHGGLHQTKGNIKYEV